MKLKFILSFALTVFLAYFLNRSWNFGTTLPAFGKFLDPFHGFWRNAVKAETGGAEIELPGTKAMVTILYDSTGIPHIFAENDEDLYFAQGYVTAKDRLWQMEFQTLAGAGRISEVVGKAALDFDRGQRRMGMKYVAEKTLARAETDPVAKAMVDNYTRGVNAWIERLDQTSLPFEYKLLDYAPEPWTNIKSAYLLANMAKTLNIGEKDLAMTNMLKLFGKETLDLLFPDNENVADPIVDNTGNWKFKPITLDSIPLAVPDELLPESKQKKTGHAPSERQALINLPMEKFDNDIGSNNWAVSGARTKTGAPMLCNDPHLKLSLPSIWYIIHLNAPGINTMGASLPGAPAVISGFNDSIAWGVTNAQRDVVDWYRIEFKDSSRQHYLSDGKWKASRKVVETFNVKGGKTFYDTVVFTHHGPVRYDKHFHGESELNSYAYKWISADAGLEFLAFRGLNRAKNHSDYLAALDHYVAPAQNFVFAAVNGDIAMRIQGKYPVRRKDEGKYVLDGSKTSQEWKAFIPNDQNVQYKNPARGFVSSANQYPADATYPYYINGDSYEAYRNRRINTLLSALHDGVPQDMMNLQGDTYNLTAAEVLPLFLSQMDSSSMVAGELAAYKSLKAWDYYNTVDAEAPAYFDAWWNAFFPMIWDKILIANGELELPTRYTTIKLIHENPDLPFFDVDGTSGKETANTIIKQSFYKGLKTIAKWREAHLDKTKIRWTEYKNTFIGHLLLGMPALSYHVEQGGGADIVNAAGPTNGPSWRMVVSLEKTGVKAWGVYPGGQSGNPGSPFYNNMIDLWSKNKYIKFHFPATAKAMKDFTQSSTTIKTTGK